MTEQTELDTLTADVHALVPILAAMQLEVIESEPGRASARIPAGPNGNHFGVTYAGCLFSVAEMLGGLLGGSSFDVTGAVPIVKRVEIDFVRPATTTVTARTELAESEIARVQAETLADGKSNFELVAEVVDEGGVVVARTRGDYQLRVLG